MALCGWLNKIHTWDDVWSVLFWLHNEFKTRLKNFSVYEREQRGFLTQIFWSSGTSNGQKKCYFTSVEVLGLVNLQVQLEIRVNGETTTTFKFLEARAACCLRFKNSQECFGALWGKQIMEINTFVGGENKTPLASSESWPANQSNSIRVQSQGNAAAMNWSTTRDVKLQAHAAFST